MLALVFQIGAERVALDVRRVQRVVPRVELAPPPAGARGLAGYFVHRGRVVSVVDLHSLSRAGECPARLNSRIILVPWPESSDRLVGLLATHVVDVRELESTAGTASPDGLGPPIAHGSSMIRHLNVDMLLATLDLEPALLSVPGGTGL